MRARRRWAAGVLALAAALVASGLVPARAAAQDLTIAAAADLQAVFPLIVSSFEQRTGRHVRTTFGSSGNFFSQIQNGAPFDLFFSADIDYPKQLEQAGLTEPGTLRPYAKGQLVLWTLKTSGIDVTNGLGVLLDPRIHHIAIANPEHAPYGRAAVAAMRAAGVYDQVASKLVLGESIAQAGQFAQTGNADVGLLALSIARAPAVQSIGAYVDVPATLYPPIEQGAVILKRAQDKTLAAQFLASFDRPEIAAMLTQFGFITWTGQPSR
ncbi:MAG: molybdate ABC transporter substrate-binding protein [Acidobacteriaceae bacterium]|jgi:molybdate transport system substrate-binding protein|nr:molybdate ABC transporter substrate-binding protein [Acidobacteriaceae bacterium]